MKTTSPADGSALLHITLNTRHTVEHPASVLDSLTYAVLQPLLQ